MKCNLQKSKYNICIISSISQPHITHGTQTASVWLDPPVIFYRNLLCCQLSISTDLLPSLFVDLLIYIYSTAHLSTIQWDYRIWRMKRTLVTRQCWHFFMVWATNITTMPLNILFSLFTSGLKVTFAIVLDTELQISICKVSMNSQGLF